MNVVSLELCKELHELSGWEKFLKSAPYNSDIKTEYVWERYAMADSWLKKEYDWSDWRLIRWQDSFTKAVKHTEVYPAYYLGYLLRKLPRVLTVNDSTDYKLRPFASGLFYKNIACDELDVWSAWYREQGQQTGKFTQSASTPEDAAARLAIELFRQGILTREATA